MPKRVYWNHYSSSLIDYTNQYQATVYIPCPFPIHKSLGSVIHAEEYFFQIHSFQNSWCDESQSVTHVE